mgnify:CR=1 FL=1
MDTIIVDSYLVSEARINFTPLVHPRCFLSQEDNRAAGGDRGVVKYRTGDGDTGHQRGLSVVTTTRSGRPLVN